MIDQDKIVDGSDDLERRIESGASAVFNGSDYDGRIDYDGWLDEARTGATDAISNILTYIVGPAGVTEESAKGYNVVHDPDALDAARELLDDALRSWEGDAEDYGLAVEDPEDNIDLDHLTTLWAKSLLAPQLSPEDSYDRGFYQGRFAEYVAQNAVDEETASLARLNASKQVYGNGPSTGAQC